MSTSKPTTEARQEAHEQEIEYANDLKAALMSSSKSGRMDENSLRAAIALIDEIQIRVALLDGLQNHELRGGVDDRGAPWVSAWDDPCQGARL